MTFTVHPASAGGWHAFVSAPRLLLVAAPDDAFVATAWSTIGSPDGFQSALDLLTSRGLAATPPFVLVEWQAGEDARVIVRGESALMVTDAAGEQSLSASGVSTWVERSLSGVTGISFTVPGAAALGTAALPLERGVALVAAIGSAGAPVPVAEELKAPAPVAEVVVAPAPVAEVPEAPSVPAAPSAPASAPEPEPEPEPDVDIEATRREAPEAEPVSAPPAAPAAPEESYDYLFGDTMFRSVADAAVHEPDPEAEAAASLDEPAEADDVDDALHDGETVLTSDIAKLRGKRRPRGEPAPPPVPPAAQKLVLVIAPTGAREALTQPILMGRSPSVGKVTGGQIPRLVTIGTVDQDISRNHAQFALEGGTVVITDLHSRNGTMVALPGKSAQKLRAGEPTSVIVGTVVDFGGGVTVTVEEES